MKIPTQILLSCAAIVAGTALQTVHVLWVNPKFDVGGWPVQALMGALSLGVVIGLVRGNRFAWQAGRILAMVSGSFLLVYGMLTIMQQLLGEASTESGLWMLAAGACFAVAAALLHGHGVRQHMNLICPRCQTATSRPATLSFSEARCRNPNCNHRW